eukprot:TRINITY_DN2161_c0_g1_i2.p1 TRINITY_DN2161_c0_g1~~TRINITY_DN2161_c0_g1_i2.p1  ORF type:complete len:287 (+),score=28.10 TRINITY_DN2161_c0_g1_i2:97-957(+)
MQQQNVKQVHFENLPYELLSYILKFFKLKEFFPLVQVSKTFKKVVLSTVETFDAFSVGKALGSLNDDCLTFVSQFKNLNSLDLVWCKDITSEGLGQSISNLKNLTRLDLYMCTQISDSVINALSSLTKLKYLDICRCKKITDKGIVCLSNLTDLKSLKIYKCENLTDQGISTVLRSSTNLIQLNASQCTGFTDKGISLLSSHVKLERLFLSHCGLTSAGMIYLSNLTNLSVLDVSGCVGLNDEAIIYLSNLVNLVHLCVGGCNFSQEKIRLLCRGLVKLNVSGFGS